MKLKTHSLITWLTWINLGLSLIILVTSLIHPPLSWFQDLGRHLKLGEIIFTSGKVPQTNLFSYTYPDYPFINHHWLSEVIFYALYQLGSDTLLGLVKILLLAGAFFLSAFTAHQNKAPLSVVALTAAITLPIFLERTHIRPEIFSLTLFAIFLYLLSQKLTRQTAALLIFLLILWVNLHIYFAAGLLLIYVYTFTQIVKHRHYRWLLFAGLATLVTLINPNGLKGALLPLNIFKDYGYTIIENQSPFMLQDFFTKPNIFLFQLSLPLTGLTVGISLFKRRWFATLTLLIFTALAYRQIRNFPLFALTALALVPVSLGPILSLKTTSSPTSLILVGLLTVTGLFQLNTLSHRLIPHTPQDQVNHLPLTLTWKTDLHAPFEFINTHRLQGPIFNNFDIAGLAIYHLYPEKVFVDNRPEAFPPEFFQASYIPMQQEPALFDQIAAAHSFNLILFSHSDITPWGETFIRWIITHPEFRLIYLDDRNLILVSLKTYPQLAELIITQENAIARLAPYINTKNPTILARLQRVTALFNWPEVSTYLDQRLRLSLK